MKIADSVQETTAGTSSSTITLGGATAGNRTLAAAIAAAGSKIAIGTTGVPFRVEDDAGNWLDGKFTITSGTVITRTSISASSAAGAGITLAGTVRKVSLVLAAEDLNDLVTLADGIAVTALPAAAALAGADIVAISQGGVDGRTTLSAIAAYVLSTQSPATALTFSGPASGAVGAASGNFTVAANGIIAGTVVVTPSDGGAGGTFTPTTRSISAGTPTGTFTYAPASAGAKTLSITNNGGLTNPAGVTYTASAAAATAITMSGPATGAVSAASANFTVAANGTIAGTVVVTPSDNGGGGSFTPTTVSLSSGTPSGTFKYTPSATAGARTISATNNGGLTNPSNITYTSTAANAPVYELRTTSANGYPNSGKWFDALESTTYTPSTDGTGYYYIQPGHGYKCEVWVRTAAGVPAQSVKAVWSKSTTVPPIAFSDTTYNGHTSTIDLCERGANWQNPGDNYYGMYAAFPYIYDLLSNKVANTRWYLWIITSDGFAAPVDNGTGIPLYVTVT